MTQAQAVSGIGIGVLLAAIVAVVATGSSPDIRSAAVPNSPFMDDAIPAPMTQWATTTGPDAENRLPDVPTMVARLAARLETQPQDADDWRMLGWSYVALDRYDEALAAFRRAIALDGSAGRYRTAYGEALVHEAGGSVTPAAKAEFEQAFARDAGDQRARYFLGLAQRQAGDARGAYATWSAALRATPTGVPMDPDMHIQLERVARELGLPDTAR